MNRNLVTAFFAVAGGSVFSSLVSAVTTPIIVRILGANEYGQYATLMAVFSLLMILTSSGLTSGVSKFLAENRDLSRWKNHVFGFYLRISVVFGLLAALILLLISYSGLVAWLFGSDYVIYFYFLSGVAVIEQLREYFRRTLMGLKLEHLSETYKGVYTVLYRTTAVVLVFFGWGVLGMLASHLLAGSFMLIIAFIFISRWLSFSAVLERTPENFPREELLSFSWQSIIFTLFVYSFYYIDVVMLSAFRTNTEVGYYRAALVLTSFLLIVPTALKSILLQSTADLWRKERKARISDLAARLTRYTVLFMALLITGLGVLASTFVPLYFGHEYEPSVEPLLLLLPGTLAFAVALPLLTISQAKGEMTVLVRVTGAAALCNFLLNVLLIPIYGVAGAAVASTVGYTLMSYFQIRGAHELGYRPLSDLRPVQAGTTIVLTTLVLLSLDVVIHTQIFKLLVIPPVGFGSFFLLSLFTGAVDEGEVIEVLGSLPSPVGPRFDTGR